MLDMNLNTCSYIVNGASPSRKTMDGVEHLVVPTTIIVQGVLNHALLKKEHFGKFVAAWDGRPVTVLHPQSRGQHVSASSPDIVEKNTIGYIYNTSVDGDKLKTELWINIDKAKKLGHGELIAQLERGEKVEVSTGYFSEHINESGEYNGKPYDKVHTNIRPDHLAILPGQIGACSIADGCGTFNSKQTSDDTFMTKVSDAIETLKGALGVKTNCGCGDATHMTTLKQRAEALVSNGKLSDKQKEIVANADEDTIAVFEALVGNADKDGKKPDEMTEEELKAKKEKEAKAKFAKEKPEANTAVDIEEMVANAVAKALGANQAGQLVDKILSVNKHDVFTREELLGMSVNSLEKLEKSTRARDYSGAGGYAVNSSNKGEAATPLVVNGLSAMFAKKEESK